MYMHVRLNHKITCILTFHSVEAAWLLLVIRYLAVNYIRREIITKNNFKIILFLCHYEGGTCLKFVMYAQ
jgi:hypothetical protein